MFGLSSLILSVFAARAPSGVVWVEVEGGDIRVSADVLAGAEDEADDLKAAFPRWIQNVRLGLSPS